MFVPGKPFLRSVMSHTLAYWAHFYVTKKKENCGGLSKFTNFLIFLSSTNGNVFSDFICQISGLPLLLLLVVDGF